MGIPVDGSAHIHGDSMLAIHNTQRPNSMLKKKSNCVCHHCCQESVAMNEFVTGHVPTTEPNPTAGLRTKVIPGGAQQDHLVMQALHDVKTA
jgi:hypothetical protein